MKNEHTGTHLILKASFNAIPIYIGTDGNLRNLRNLKAKKIRCRC